MGLDFDLRNFIEDMRACKPPYKCPWEDCGKVYKTFSGITLHLQSSHHNENDGFDPSVSDSPPGPFYRSPLKDSLSYLETDKILEFEAEGRIQRFSVLEPLTLVGRLEWEASLPPEALSNDRRPSPTPDPPAKNSKKRRFLVQEEETSQPKKPQTLKLPEAVFSEIPDYYEVLRESPVPLPDSYYKFIEKSAENLDAEVEYDMDEEDVAWLDIINDRRSSENMAKITEDQFELLMDRLEKESYFHVQSNGLLSKEFSQPIDDDAICCVCMDGECSNTNVILFCDLCNLAVHQECYGVPYIPEGQWLCRRCLQSPSRSVECCLCPNRGGAFKQTDDGRWAHVVCGLWIPEVRFANTVFLEPIDSIDNIPPARWKLSCRVCKQRGAGACIQCHKTNCYTAFHVTCGLLAGLHMKMDTVRESSATGLSVTVRKTAFCDVHTPADSDCKPKLDDIAALGISTPKMKARSPKKASEISPLPVLFRGLMNFSPQCPWEKVRKIASLINVQGKSPFFQRLMAYWTLKRQTRNGVPLIRRLQFAKATRPDKAPETPQKNAYLSKKKKESPGEKSSESPAPPRSEGKFKKGKSKKSNKAKDEFKAMLEQRKLLRRLRQDLERVRLLCELIRKREQRKRELIIIDEKRVEIELAPFTVFLGSLVESLAALDQHGFFAEPVSIEEVPDYLDHIKNPMDFSTMQIKINTYKSIEDFEKDITLIVENCLSYNEKDTIFYRAGLKLRDQGGSIIRHARRQIEAIGFDSCGLHAPTRKSTKEEVPKDDVIMKEIDEFVSEDNPLKESDPSTYLKKLLEYQDKATFIHHPVAKNRRLKVLKQEITITRRKSSMDRAGTSPGFRTKATEDVPVKRKRDVSPEDSCISTPRRLRPGNKETPSSETPATSKKRGRKRLKKPDEDGATPSEPQAKKSKSDPTDTLVNSGKTSSISASSGKSANSISPATKSPIGGGVNRRNAVLFTRKKISASSTPKGSEERGSKKAGKVGEDSKKSSAQIGKSSPLQSKNSEDIEMEVRSPPKPKEDLNKTAGQPMSPPSSTIFPKKRGRRPKPIRQPSPVKVIKPFLKPSSDPSEKKDTLFTSSFQHYRRGGIGDLGETDEETQSESATDINGTSEDDTETETDSDTSGTESSGGVVGSHRIPLEPLDLVWAKTRGYPWYPALIINPKMPRTGYLHNGVPIPVPPQDVLDMASSHSSPHYLILFFDSKRTWQWLQRDKLEPLGVDSKLDKAKLAQAKKPSEKKAVKKAYEESILHRCKVTGESAVLSEESADERH